MPRSRTGTGRKVLIDLGLLSLITIILASLAASPPDSPSIIQADQNWIATRTGVCPLHNIQMKRQIVPNSGNAEDFLRAPFSATTHGPFFKARRRLSIFVVS